jgi:hypothetical protein
MNSNIMINCSLYSKAMNLSATNTELLPILMLGNNPIELSSILERLKDVKGGRFVTKFAFDLKSSLQCLSTFTPRYIIIDDNIGKSELKLSLKSFLKSRTTKDVPITILKNSNYEESLYNGPLNYLLKSNLTGELLYRSLKNSNTYRQAQEFLQEAYRKRKGKLKQLLRVGF